MSFQIHKWIKATALCESPFLRVVEFVFDPSTGVEMIIHAVIFGLTTAALLAQKAGGKPKGPFPEIF